MRSRRRQAGFTLLEIVVALGIIAVALGAAMKGVGAHINNAAELKRMTLAHWVGMNALTEMQLAGKWPSPKTYKGSATMAGIEWRWQAKVTAQEGDFVRRVDMSVSADDQPDQALATLIGFVGKP